MGEAGKEWEKQSYDSREGLAETLEDTMNTMSMAVKSSKNQRGISRKKMAPSITDHSVTIQGTKSNIWGHCAKSNQTDECHLITLHEGSERSKFLKIECEVSRH